MGRKIGYARVSTGGQEIGLDWQVDQLTRAGVKPDDIYSEHITGTKANRPELRNALRALWDGDQLVVVKLDRLAKVAQGPARPGRRDPVEGRLVGAVGLQRRHRDILRAVVHLHHGRCRRVRSLPRLGAHPRCSGHHAGPR